jgi:hypothetical protein
VRSLFEEVEPHYEDRALLSYVAHTHDCTRPRPNTGKATDRRGQAARSDEAEGTRWLQARWNGQRDEALGGRMHGRAGAKNRCASRRARSVGPRRGERDHPEGSAVTLQFITKPRGHPRALPRDKPPPRRPCADTGRISRLFSTSWTPTGAGYSAELQLEREAART